MSENLERYHRRLAKESIRSEVGYPLLMLWAAAILISIRGAQELPALRGYLFLGSGLVFGVAAVGLHRTLDWARKLAGTIFLLLSLLALWELVFGEVPWTRAWNLLIAIGATLYFFSKEAGQAFALARGETPTDPDEPSGSDR